MTFDLKHTPAAFGRRRTSVRLAAAAATLALGVGAGAATAHAESYDQLNRPMPGGNGGYAPEITTPIFTSDTGRTAIYEEGLPNGNFGTKPVAVYQRDVVSNTTTLIGERGNTTVVGVDAAEKQLLVKRVVGDQEQLVVLSTVGDPERVILTFAPGAVPDAVITGDGTSVVLSSEGEGTRVVSIATGKVTRTLGAAAMPLRQRFSASDDGSVVAGGARYDGGYYDASGFHQTGWETTVSPDGSRVAWVQRLESYEGRYPYELVIRTLSTGAQTRAPIASELESQIDWIAPDGQKFVVGPYRWGRFDDGVRAYTYDVASKTWALFGNAYEGGIGGRGDLSYYPVTVISRSGRFATLRNNNQVSLVDVEGRTLPGGGDPLTVSAYFQPQIELYCEGTGRVLVTFKSPGPWVPTPRAAFVTTSFDGTVAAGRVLNQVWSPEIGFEEPSWTHSNVPSPAGAKTVDIDMAVLDHRFRIVRDTVTKTLDCPAG